MADADGSRSRPDVDAEVPREVRKYLVELLGLAPADAAWVRDRARDRRPRAQTGPTTDWGRDA